MGEDAGADNGLQFRDKLDQSTARGTAHDYFSPPAAQPSNQLARSCQSSVRSSPSDRSMGCYPLSMRAVLESCTRVGSWHVGSSCTYSEYGAGADCTGSPHYSCAPYGVLGGAARVSLHAFLRLCPNQDSHSRQSAVPQRPCSRDWRHRLPAGLWTHYFSFGAHRPRPLVHIRIVPTRRCYGRL